MVEGVALKNISGPHPLERQKRPLRNKRYNVLSSLISVLRWKTDRLIRKRKTDKPHPNFCWCPTPVVQRKKQKSNASGPMEISCFRFLSSTLHDHSFFPRMMGE